MHIHVPEGAVPKDGPSAGVTLTTALTSAFTGIPVRQDVAMTGEITLRGRVLPIGGLKEKTMAAYRAGTRVLVIPKENVKDLEEIPAYVLSQFSVVAADTVEDVLQEALVRLPEGMDPCLTRVSNQYEKGNDPMEIKRKARFCHFHACLSRLSEAVGFRRSRLSERAMSEKAV